MITNDPVQPRIEEPEDGVFCNSDGHEDMSFYQLQCQVKEWVKGAFPNHSQRASWMPLMGAVEELGELSHAHLKMSQGIRGTKEELTKDAKDAVADAN